MKVELSKGLQLSLSGKPNQFIHKASHIASVALLPCDHIGLKASLLVKKGDTVKKGQILFTDKKTQLNYTSPACGVVSQIAFGEKRSLTLLQISKCGDDEEVFASYSPQQLKHLQSEQVRENLLQSGLWTAFRTRPYSKNPAPNRLPHAIFVTAIDTNPLAVDPAVVIAKYTQSFSDGLCVLSKLASVPIYICQSVNNTFDVPKEPSFKIVSFDGPHPSGLPGTHIHFLDPASAEKTVWHIHYQDVIAIGKLFTSGKIWAERIIAIGGPSVKQPRLIETTLGASLNDLTKDELTPGQHRIISGSILSGREVTPNHAYLGRYHYQISVLEETSTQSHVSWFRKLKKRPHHHFTTAIQGRTAAMIPLENFERVMPLNILPTPLLKALLIGDLDTAIALGALELDEEDLALCTYTCCSKQDYGSALRACLTQIETDTA